MKTQFCLDYKLFQLMDNKCFQSKNVCNGDPKKNS